MAAKRNRKITLKDVASRAGVSVTTVSNVIREWPYISDELRHKVERAIHELGYVPDPIAQGLRTGRTRTIGFIIADLTNPFQGTIVSTVEDVANDRGFSVLVSNTRGSEAQERDSVLQMISRRVDGLLIVHAHGAHYNVELMRRIDIPFVLLDRVPQAFNGPYCKVDSYAVVRLVMEHLRDLGHRRIAHLCGPKDVVTAQERLRGYLQIIDQFSPGYCCVIENRDDSWRAEAGYRAMRAFFDSADADLPTAIFASNDPIAIGASRAIRERGLRVPEDVSLVGIDDIEVDQYIDPPLTSIHQPIAEMAQKAIQILLQLIEGGKPEIMQYSLQPQLIVRHSTASPARE